MTPEERARQLIREWAPMWDLELHIPNKAGITSKEDLIAMIAAAIAEEREACAKVARTRGLELLNAGVTNGDPWGVEFVVDEIAAAIRART